MPSTAILEEYEFGASWTQREGVLRGSHALKHDGKVWLIDPVDSPGDVERAIGDGEVVGVIQLLDRHNRDCMSVGERLGVPTHRLPEELPGTPFIAFSVIDRPKWREVGLWWPEQRALVVAEAIGSGAELAVADTGISIHPLLRLTPPGVLRDYLDAVHLLPGHGAPIHAEDLGERIQRALDRSRSDIPHLLTRLPAAIKAANA
jgi:hypothetical protein